MDLMGNILIIVSMIIVFIGISSMLIRSTKPCPECGGTMTTVGYIGDRNGPAVDNILWECKDCNYNEQELV